MTYRVTGSLSGRKLTAVAGDSTPAQRSKCLSRLVLAQADMGSFDFAQDDRGSATIPVPGIHGFTFLILRPTCTTRPGEMFTTSVGSLTIFPFTFAAPCFNFRTASLTDSARRTRTNNLSMRS